MYGYTAFLCTFQLMGVWVACTLGQLWITLLWTLEHKFLCEVFSFFFGIYLGVELQGNMVTLFNLLGTARLFSKDVALFYIATSCVWAFRILHTLRSTSYYLSYNHTTSWTVVSRSFDMLSLMANDVEDLFMYLLVVYISSNFLRCFIVFRA